jgi:gas vesicle protein
MHHNNNSNSMSVITAFLIGGLIGAGVALLMAPQAGHETRSMLKNRGEELRDKASDMAHEKTHETRQRAERVMDDLADRTKRTTEEMRKRGHDVMDDAEKRF